MPICTVIAGPNGAGKTKFTDILIKKGFNTTLPVNLDLLDGEIDEYISGNIYNWEQNLRNRTAGSGFRHPRGLSVAALQYL